MPANGNTIDVSDIFVIGGGVNGCGIARDAAGRGLSVTLAEMGDLAQATSSASSKLFHGGLRYLEYFEFGLVKHSLQERETLLKAMPHISWPMRFVLPFHPEMRFDSTTPTSRLLSLFMPWMKGRRPAWLIRLGLFLYDHLGGRKILPPTRFVDLTTDRVGAPLQPKYQKAYEYSDCWVQDSRLVVLNAVDARDRGASILTRTKVVKAERQENLWTITTECQDTGERRVHRTRAVVNAAGPWVADVLGDALNVSTSESVRLVRGSHIVVPKIFEHDQPYILQGTDGRIVFAIPYEDDFTLIGTTDVDHSTDPLQAECTDEETAYLCDFASKYFTQPIKPEDVIWSFSGVRPLYDDGASNAMAATRDYVLSLNTDGAPLLSIFGGKITTYRRLAEQALDQILPFFPGTPGHWTAGVSLPGGAFSVDGVDAQIAELKAQHPFLDARWARRLVQTYGTNAKDLLKDASSPDDLGTTFGATLTEAEVRWLMTNEFAKRAYDVVWRRTKLGLRLSQKDIDTLDIWMQQAAAKGDRK